MAGAETFGCSFTTALTYFGSTVLVDFFLVAGFFALDLVDVFWGVFFFVAIGQA